MTNKTKHKQSLEDELFSGTQGSIHVSSAGFEFNAADDEWSLDSETDVNVSFVANYKEEYQAGIRATLIHFSTLHSAKYVWQHTHELRRYLKNGSDFTLDGLLAYRAVCPERSRSQSVSVLRCFLRQMIYLGFSLPSDFMQEFNSWVLGGSERGIPVLTEDPVTGPFSELEFRAIKAGLNCKYAEGRLSHRQFSLAQLFAATFRRPANLKQLKIKDLKRSSSVLKTKQLTFEINIPRSKGTGRRFRSQFTPFALVSDIGTVIEKHIENEVKKLEASISRKLSKEEIGELPLFFNHRLYVDLNELDHDKAFDYLKTEIPHLSTNELVSELISTIDMLEIVSERTGERLHVNSYRFRYTGGTRAAESGAGTVTIAHLLDHSDTQHVGVYVANSPEIGIQISKIMNNPLARYASAFQGKVVDDEQDALAENPGATRIPCREKECDVGSCGSNSFCTDYAPIACYLCAKFRPWKNAPHYLVLNWLLEERARLESTGSDPKVIAINDAAILAAAQVIKACEEEKSKDEG